MTAYTITDADVAGPYVKHIPSAMDAKASLDRLGYSSMLEALGERFHCKPELLKRLNRAAKWTAGEKIQVPNVPTAPPAAGGYVRVVVSKANGTLLVQRGNDVVFFAPVTSGSQHDPLPIGDWKVTGIVHDPKFHYDPNLFWNAEAGDVKTTIPPGPNNPVGVVWVDISKPHYGLHGTPEPSTIGHTTSHGCVRLTNWDATTLASLVKVGTPVLFRP